VAGGSYRCGARVWLGQLHEDSGDPRCPCRRCVVRMGGGPGLGFRRGARPGGQGGAWVMQAGAAQPLGSSITTRGQSGAGQGK
jgi:hypothetical protein